MGWAVFPVSDTDVEVAGALTFTFNEAVRVMAVPLGVNVTLTVQLAPAARPVPPMGQFTLVDANRNGAAPVRVMLVMMRGAPPTLDTVTACAALVTNAVEVNVKAVGATDRIGASTPVMVSVPGT